MRFRARAAPRIPRIKSTADSAVPRYSVTRIPRNPIPRIPRIPRPRNPRIPHIPRILRILRIPRTSCIPRFPRIPRIPRFPHNPRIPRFPTIPRKIIDVLALEPHFRQAKYMELLYHGITLPWHYSTMALLYHGITANIFFRSIMRSMMREARAKRVISRYMNMSIHIYAPGSFFRGSEGIDEHG